MKSLKKKRVRSFSKYCGALAICGVIAFSVSACESNPFSDIDDSLGGGGTVTVNPEEANFDALIAEAKALDVSDTAFETNTALDKAYTSIILADGATVVGGLGNAAVDGNVITISEDGTYLLTGALSDGRIVVDKAVNVHLILNGVNITSSVSAPLSLMKKADSRVITLVEGTTNVLTDASEYTVFDNTEIDENGVELIGDEPNGALFSKRDLTINGTGTLLVNGNYNNGISCKGSLKILGGSITVNAKNNALKGNDSVVIKGGTLNLVSQGDGIKSDNEESGFVYIENASLNIAALEDSVQADKILYVKSGIISAKSGDGADAYRPSDDISRKGLKAGGLAYFESADVIVDSYDDAIHSNGSVVIDGGDFALSAGDDAVHADLYAVINGGNIDILKSYEGIEAAKIVINSGLISIISGDDGINASDGSEGLLPGQSNPNCSITVNGGHITVDASGDGIDSNGTVFITGGTVTVYGPVSSADAALDSGGGILINGGTLLAGGPSGMVEAPAKNSGQNVVCINFSAKQAAGTAIALKDSNGDLVLTYTGKKAFQSLIVSSAVLVAGETYTVYSDNTKLSTLTISGIITNAGSSSSGGRPRLYPGAQAGIND